MLKTARYSAVPHPSNQRHHKMPVEVVRTFLDRPDAKDGDLDGIPLLFEAFIISSGQNVSRLAPVIIKPISGGEIRFGKRNSSEYPDSFSPGEFLIVQVTQLSERR